MSYLPIYHQVQSDVLVKSARYVLHLDYTPLFIQNKKKNNDATSGYCEQAKKISMFIKSRVY